MTRPHHRNPTDQNRITARARPIAIIRASCLLLALAFPGLSPVPASAQGTFLLSNLGGDIAGSGFLNLNDSQYAQSFTTGPAAHGYNIDGAILYMKAVSDPAAPLSVTIRSNDSQSPADSAIATLTRSADLVADSENEFQAQGAVHLQPNTKYWIMAELTNGPVAGAAAQWATVATGSPPGSDFGWAMSETATSDYGGHTWHDVPGGASFNLTLGIKGTEAPPPPPPLLGNLGGDETDSFNVHRVALGQKFTTGPAAYGYDVESVVVHFLRLTGPTAVQVTIRNDAGGDPGSTPIAVLQKSGGLDDSSQNEFLLTSGSGRLLPNETYWFTVGRLTEASETSVANVRTRATPPESDFGWAHSGFARRYIYADDAWTTSISRYPEFEIKGAEAPPPPTLLSNLGGIGGSTTSLNLDDAQLAQSFVTGPAANGYNIAGAALYFRTVSDPAAPVSVTIRSDNAGDPADSAIAELSRSANLVADSENEFVPQGDVHLQPNTKYWIMAERPNGPVTGATARWATVAIGSLPGSAVGWTTSDSENSSYGQAAWFDARGGSGRDLAFAIRGVEAAASGTPGGPGGPTVSDPRTRALEYNLASIGRALTATVVSHVWDRAARLDPDGNRTLAMVGGRVIDAGAFAEGVDAERVSRAIAGIFGGARTEAAELRALLPDARALREQTRLELTAGGESGAAGSTAFWGRGDYTAFEGQGGGSFPGFSTEGEVVSAHIGFDRRMNPETLIGVAVGQSKGETSHSFSAGGDRHGTRTELLSVHPYLYWKPAGGNRVWWGMAGYGTGDATLTEGASRATTDIALRSYGIGVREASRRGAFTVAVKADAFLTEIVADAVRSGPITIGEAKGKASRVRAALEGTREWALEGDATLSGAAELGLRVDGRDGATGKGTDIAGQLHYASPRSGLDVTLQGSTLLSHGAKGFREWGLGLLVVYDPGASGKGLQLTLNPSWNTPRSGVAGALWDAGPGAAGRRASSERGAALGLRLGYGMAAMHDRARLTVYGEADGDRDASHLRLGAELRPMDADRFGLEVYAERQERAAGDDNALELALELAF